MRQSYLQATLPYFGSKASVIGDILRATSTVLPRSAWPQATLVDAFTGGGSTALAFKRVGFKVVTNDLAERACIVARALIANSTVRLTEADELRLHAGHATNDHRIEREMSPTFFRPDHARWLDGAFAAARATTDEARRNLLLLVLEHAVLRVRAFADFSRTAPTEAAAEGDWDAVRLSVGGIKRMAALTPHTLVGGLRARVNAGVFLNGREGHEVHQRDVLDFVRAVHGEVLYCDSPYPGSNSYEKTYRGLDVILEGRERLTSGFNQAGALELLDALLESAAHIPAWVVSFGGPKITPAEFLTRVQRHRPSAQAAPINLRYRVGTAVYGDSGAQREVLVTAVRGAP